MKKIYLYSRITDCCYWAGTLLIAAALFVLSGCYHVSAISDDTEPTNDSDTFIDSNKPYDSATSNTQTNDTSFEAPSDSQTSNNIPNDSETGSTTTIDSDKVPSECDVINECCDGFLIKEKFCLIHGVCYPDMIGNNPANTCQYCDSMWNKTAWRAKSDNTNCDDNNYCNGADSCVSGICTHAGDPCANNGLCQNVCNDESCNAPTTTKCDNDNDFCNGGGYCNGIGGCKMTDEVEFAFCSINTAGFELLHDFSYDICVEGACISPGSCNASSCDAPGLHFELPKISPSDSDYTIGTNTVTDNDTGLIWQKNIPADSYSGCTGPAERSCTWEEALKYCDNLSLDNKTDWYLPNVFELQTIVDYNKSAPAISSAFPSTLASTVFWTSTTIKTNTDDYAPYIHFETGEVNQFSKSGTYFVRCVRREEIMLGERFTRSLVNGASATENVVKDRYTGLTWQGCSAHRSGTNCQTLDLNDPTETYAAAKQYCTNLDWAGEDGWELPNIKQLASLTNFRREGNTANPEGCVFADSFPNLAPFGFWSSTTSSENAGTHAWSNAFTIGSVRPILQTQKYMVICVTDENLNLQNP